MGTTRRTASHRRRVRLRFGVLAVLVSLCTAMPAMGEAPARHRVLISTDIGGSDPDDFQSMVHLLLFADSIDIDGLVSSPPGPGRKQHILDVIDVYAEDFGNLHSHSAEYPEPAALRAVTKQAAVDMASWHGFGQPTEGSDWIIAVARRDDPRPLHVLGDFAERLDRSKTAADAPVGWSESILHRESSWYATGQAREIAGHVLGWQSVEGAWPKNIDLSQPATPAATREASDAGRTNTIDNDATVLPMHFLALVAQATGYRRYQAAFERALDYLIAAQYSNGGWPQFYPLRAGYFSRITFNHNAMINVMLLLREVSDGGSEFAFVDPERRSRAATAVARGIDCIQQTQIRQDGVLTAWSAQYDQVTLAPAWARTYEPPSLSGRESVGIVRFLMEIERPTPEQAAAIEAAIAWLRRTAVRGLSYHRGAAGRATDGFVVTDPDAAPLWARFYDLDSNHPIFTGRDSVIHYSLDELDRERRGGYAYYGSWAATLLSDDYPRWRERLSGTTSDPAAAEPVVWKLDNLETIGGHAVTVAGNPRLVDTPGGKAIEFDGVDDGIFVDVHPLDGLREFTVEVTFRPDKDGPPEQRFFHMQEERSESRVMLETRLVENARWFLDTFIKSGDQNVVLYASDNEHVIGPWYHAAIVVDDRSFSHFVNGRLELVESIDYEAQVTGRTSIGVRLNEVHWFKGAIRTIRFTPRALDPGEFLRSLD